MINLGLQLGLQLEHRLDHRFDHHQFVRHLESDILEVPRRTGADMECPQYIAQRIAPLLLVVRLDETLMSTASEVALEVVPIWISLQLEVPTTCFEATPFVR